MLFNWCITKRLQFREYAHDNEHGLPSYMTVEMMPYLQAVSGIIGGKFIVIEFI
ncbi:MAG: hypothetical protein K6L80_07860 [Agarilytica sp.]